MEAGCVEFIGADGNRLVADKYGSSGRPVLMLHGGGQTRHAWDATGRHLAESGLQAWSADQRGHGDSEWEPEGKYAFADFARDVIVMSDRIFEETGERPIVIGASLGGIAGMLAEGKLRPGTLSALVLVDITPRVDPNGVSKIIDFMAERMHEGFATVEEAADAIASYLPHRARPSTLDGLKKNLRLHEDGRYRWHWDPKFIESRHADDADPARLEKDLVAAAEALRVPSLLVRGKRSELVTDDHVDEFLSLVPHAEFKDVQGAGHMVAGDKNDAFADAVIGFLTRLQAA
ncbi:alpha/beta hydrolase [Rhizobiales bacterium]|uniref:alpha/beta fold hydrolase n=1 Tax=Hongsoonwoonella zoysiae TaxID=2821844 RepID=UPI0015617553|nr:alpha/beta hydrolase [Hongsoonwoonella zoysiae]NRG18112.1 alpha/beta hydrolase [Hongsoonwoonella zoysiae]